MPVHEAFRSVLLAGLLPVLVLGCAWRPDGNVALGKRYTVSPAPNYRLTAPPSDTTALTDGRHTSGKFWMKPSTLGWQQSGTVEIMLDLERECGVTEVAFNTARGAGDDVCYPRHLYLFAGSAERRFTYVGDLARQAGNVPGEYKEFRFALRFPALGARYVLLEAVPEGEYLFCDEIEVLEGTGPGGRAGDTLSVETVRRRCRAMQDADARLALLLEYVRRLREQASAVPDLRERAAALESRTAGSGGSDLPLRENELYQLRAALLAHASPQEEILARPLGPWARFSPMDLPAAQAGGMLEIALPCGGTGNGAVVITNLRTDSTIVRLAAEEQKGASLQLSIHPVGLFYPAGGGLTADPLLPATDTLLLGPGESKLCIICARSLSPGEWTRVIEARAGSRIAAVQLKVRVFPVRLPSTVSTHTVNWGYLDFALIRDVKAGAVDDLLDHYMNVAVVPPGELPEVDSPEAAARFINYLKLHHGFRTVLLYMELGDPGRRTVGGRYTFMDTQWQAWFKQWYTGAVHAASAAGFAEADLFVYPFDEMKGEEVDRFITLAQWARSEIRTVKFSATVDAQSAMRALPYLDIAQVADRPDLQLPPRREGKQTWLYCLMPRSAEPYAGARLLPWKAFLHDLDGVGFWNYADVQNPGEQADGGSDRNARRPDYAVVYRGSRGELLSSRRWEAWKTGVEDVELLRMYALREGKAAAQALAASVLSSTEDQTRAEEVRLKLLRTLSSGDNQVPELRAGAGGKRQ